jgi:3-hydroxy-9,10-secoandrosta-1,3,5(10)-triene-9,17-dione monooxygenase reductase component
MAGAAASPAGAPPDPRRFRDALGRFATGVALVTAAPDGVPTGLLVNSLSSVSLQPPLISFCPSRASLTWSRMRHARHFAVNVLGRRHEPYAHHASPAGADRFADLHWHPGHHGAPLLADALATLQCQTVAEHPTGDHWIVVARVEELDISPNDDPLIFYAGTYTGLRPST